MLNLFVGPERENVGVVRLLAKYRGTAKASSQLFQPVDVSVREIFKIVDSVDAADAILFPHDYASVMEDRDFVSEYEKLSESSGKKNIVFSFSDRDISVKMRNAIVLRTSAYRYKLSRNEIIVAPLIEDIGAVHGVAIRHKRGIPSVGFVGLASWPSVPARVLAYVRQGWLLLKSFLFCNTKLRVHTQGVFIRRRVICELKKSNSIHPLLITRRTFSGLAKTISLPAEEARGEYIHIMKESDFCLAPKGDGNYSLRFFEALSMGRIPVVIDTDVVLPFENRIAYDDVIIRVALKDIKNIGTTIADIYKNMSEEEFIARQRKARQIFEEYLKPDKFYNILFEEFATAFRSR